MGEAPSQERPAFGWTAPQRRALLVILSALCLGLGVRYACNPVYVGDPQPDHPARFGQLADRIDPNTADLQTLTAIPALGEKRAQAIVEFRELRAARRPDRPAFTTAEDLLAVRGIGPAMVENLRPYLVFTRHPPATGP